MDHRQLEYFLEVCQEKSFSKASKNLFISQQGLSKSIQTLEEELKVPLFLRNNIGIELTPYGEELRKFANPYVSQHQYILSVIEDMKAEQKETLTIGFATGIFDLLPPDFLSGFILEHAESNIRIKSFTDDECGQALLEFKLNIGILPAPVDFSQFDSVFSQRRKINLLVGKKHRFAEMSSIRMDDLVNERLISLNTRTSSQDLLRDICSRHNCEPSILINAAEIGLAGELVESGAAVSFYAGREHAGLGNVSTVEIEDLDIYWEFHIVVNKKTYHTELAREFIEYACRKLMS
nr:LysR family transcriptional regulator [Youngiibacter multivorans]